MKNNDLNQMTGFKTSKDYSKLSFLELIIELERACQDLADYRKQMVAECNAIRREASNGRKMEEII